MIAAIVVKNKTAVGKSEEKVRDFSGDDEVELFRIEGYDEHSLATKRHKLGP